MELHERIAASPTGVAASNGNGGDPFAELKNRIHLALVSELGPRLFEVEDGAHDIRVRAAGVNPVDWKIADGLLKHSVEARFPLILGQDGAGVVEEVGEGVARLRQGEQVYGVFGAPERGLGSYAEYAKRLGDRLKDRIFRDPNAPDPFHQAAGVRDGVMSILIGIAALKSAQSGEAVKIGDLTSLQPLPVRPKST